MDCQFQSRIREFVVENFLFGKSNGLGDEDSFLENGIIDSTGVLELVAFLEENYAIRVEDDELIPENLDSVHLVSQYLSRKLNGEGQEAVL